MKEQFGKEVHPITIKRFLKGIGKTWKRIRASLKDKRNKEEFKECKSQIEELEFQQSQGHIKVCYFDEMGVSLQPTISYAWQDKNETIGLPTILVTNQFANLARL